MTTPASGAISFSQIRDELDWNTSLSLGAYRPRILSQKASGTIKTSDLYNKSAKGKTWTVAQSAPTNIWYNTYNSPQYVNGRYFYSTYDLSTTLPNVGVLYSSTSGTSFSQVGSISTQSTLNSAGVATYYGVVYGNGTYVAYGQSNDVNHHHTGFIQTATEASMSFTTRYTTTNVGNVNSNYQFGAYNSSVGKFIVCGPESTNSNIVASSDGITWTTSSFPSGYSIGGVFSVGNALFASVSYSSTGASYIIRSTDGLNWTAVVGLDSYSYYSGKVFHTGTYYVTTNSTNGTLKYYVSEDGISWTSAYTANTPTASGNLPFGGIVTPQTIPELGAYFAAGSNYEPAAPAATSTGAIWKSTDFANWTCVYQNPNGACRGYYDVAWTGLATIFSGGGSVCDEFGCYGSTSNFLELSATGTTNFINKSSGYTPVYTGVVFSKVLGITSDNSKPLIVVTPKDVLISQ